MQANLPHEFTVFSGCSNSHLQGIAIDEKREYMYLSFTTSLLKTDLRGNVLGSVDGLAGHLGCIAYNATDGKVYGSLEFKHDSIGEAILRRAGVTGEILDGFYIVSFDVEKITSMHMDAEADGVMKAVFLREVYEDYTAPGHRYGCSGIDGITFAPAAGKTDGKQYLYVAYGIYADTEREDNDHQVILCYDISCWDAYAKPLNQHSMHRCGPESPEAKYFVFTGNTRYGIQNLEYDACMGAMVAAVYTGAKPQYPNYPMYFIDCAAQPEKKQLSGLREEGLCLPLKRFSASQSEICGSSFPHGSTGMASLGDGYFYIAEPFQRGNEYCGVIRLYRFDWDTQTFLPVQKEAKYE